MTEAISTFGVLLTLLALCSASPQPQQYQQQQQFQPQQAQAAPAAQAPQAPASVPQLVPFDALVKGLAGFEARSFRKISLPPPPEAQRAHPKAQPLRPLPRPQQLPEHKPQYQQPPPPRRQQQVQPPPPRRQQQVQQYQPPPQQQYQPPPQQQQYQPPPQHQQYQQQRPATTPAPLTPEQKRQIAEFDRLNAQRQAEQLAALKRLEQLQFVQTQASIRAPTPQGPSRPQGRPQGQTPIYAPNPAHLAPRQQQQQQFRPQAPPQQFRPQAPPPQQFRPQAPPQQFRPQAPPPQQFRPQAQAQQFRPQAPSPQQFRPHAPPQQFSPQQFSPQFGNAQQSLHPGVPQISVLSNPSYATGPAPGPQQGQGFAPQQGFRAQGAPQGYQG